MFLESGAVLLADAPTGAYRVAIVEGDRVEGLLGRAVPPSAPLVESLRARGDVLARHEVQLNPAYQAGREELDRTMQALGSDLMLPVVYKDRMPAIVSLGGKKSGKMFTPEDLDLLRTLANQSAIALENAKLFQENLEKGRLEEELKIAHDIQTSMLPERPPDVPGFQLAARSIPAREVGGDFYDFIEIPADGGAPKLAIIVGDVSGKGVSGALMMAASRSTYRVLLGAGAPSVVNVMTLANDRLNKDIRKGMFVALVYAVWDPIGKTLTLSNAGQTQPILCRAGETTAGHIETEGDTFPLGIVPDCRYEATRSR
jgi:hypothetical protein